MPDSPDDYVEDARDALHARVSKERDSLKVLHKQRDYLLQAIGVIHVLWDTAMDSGGDDNEMIPVKIPVKVLRDICRENGENFRRLLEKCERDIEVADDFYYSSIFDLGVLYTEKRAKNG